MSKQIALICYYEEIYQTYIKDYKRANEIYTKIMEDKDIEGKKFDEIRYLPSSEKVHPNVIAALQHRVNPIVTTKDMNDIIIKYYE